MWFYSIEQGSTLYFLLLDACETRNATNTIEAANKIPPKINISMIPSPKPIYFSPVQSRTKITAGTTSFAAISNFTVQNVDNRLLRREQFRKLKNPTIKRLLEDFLISNRDVFVEVPIKHFLVANRAFA